MRVKYKQLVHDTSSKKIQHNNKNDQQFLQSKLHFCVVLFNEFRRQCVRHICGRVGQELGALRRRAAQVHRILQGELHGARRIVVDAVRHLGQLLPARRSARAAVRRAHTRLPAGRAARPQAASDARLCALVSRLCSLLFRHRHHSNII